MKQLDPDWLTKGLIDFEYKKYLILSYLQDVKACFNDKKLYPPLSELFFHYKNLIQVRNNKQLLQDQFPKEMTNADFEKLQLVYKSLINDDRLMQELEDILSFAIPEFKQVLEEGKEIYEDVDQNLVIEPIGLVPLYTDEGYILLTQLRDRIVNVYQYDITIFHHADEKYRGIHTKLIDTFSQSITNTIQAMKISLIRKYPSLPNPATYLISAPVGFPEKETVLPVAQLALVRYLAEAK